MLHCDEETLSLLALGESGPEAVQEHLAECERCRAELAALRQVVDTARSGDLELIDIDHAIHELHQLGLDEAHWHDVPRIEPPARVWDQIAAATGVQAVPQSAETEPADGRQAAPVAEPIAEPAPPPARRAEPAPAVPAQRSRASWISPRLLAIAAGCLVIGVLGGIAGDRLLSDDVDPGRPAPVVAATRLDGLPAAPGASGQADVTETAQGRTLDLDVRQLGAADGFYEVWLIDPTVTKMVPVGVLSGTAGRFSLPAGVNLADYPLVDVSIEPLDGNPAHSGKSVLRGTLRS